MSRKDKVVSYFYDEEGCNYNYGGGNPMRPHRVRLTNSLINGYGLDKRLAIQRPSMQSPDNLTRFHADDYIDFLSAVTPDNQEDFLLQMRRFNLGPVGEADCPVFDGMFQYFQTYTGGSVGGAEMLNKGDADICLNWSGGMHHAKKAEASGFCYINDIVLAILELLKVHQRVLYVDIDIHHGDGVEEAFYTTNRVMTCSFHKYGDFFPGTGDVRDVGFQGGKYYSVNVPLREGMDDESYRYLYEPIMSKVMELYQPGAIVMCCGADSLSGDRLGCFNLSLQGHSNCIEFLARYNVPLLVLGGGGYTMRNVARCWCYETGRLLGTDLPNALPEASLRQYDYYYDTHQLRISVSNMRNMNGKEQLEQTLTTVLQNLKNLEPVPSVQIKEVPPQHVKEELPEEDMEIRGGGQAYDDKRRAKEHDYASDEEDTVKPDRDVKAEPVKREGTRSLTPPLKAEGEPAAAPAEQAPVREPTPVAGTRQPTPPVPTRGPSRTPPPAAGPSGWPSEGPSGGEGKGSIQQLGSAEPVTMQERTEEAVEKAQEAAPEGVAEPMSVDEPAAPVAEHQNVDAAERTDMETS